MTVAKRKPTKAEYAERNRKAKLRRPAKVKKAADPRTIAVAEARQEYLDRIAELSASGAAPRTAKENARATYDVPPARIVPGGLPGSARRR